jgi:hypothetical protein
MAKKFIEDMYNRIGNAGFRTWTDVLAGESAEDVQPTFDPTVLPLDMVQKYKLQAEVHATLAKSGSVSDSAIETIIAWHHGEYRNGQIDKARKYLDRLRTPKFYEAETTARDLIERWTDRKVSVALNMEPQDHYETEDLVRFIRDHRPLLGVTDWTTLISRVRDGDKVSIEMTSEVLRKLQAQMYRAPTAKVRRLHGKDGVLTEVANELASNLYRAGQASPDQDKGTIPKLVNAAASHLFGLHDATEDGPMDRPAYHDAIIGRWRSEIQRIARGWFIQGGHGRGFK